MKYEIYVIPTESSGVNIDQHIASFENVDEDMIINICQYIETIRDVSCRYEEEHKGEISCKCRLLETVAVPNLSTAREIYCSTCGRRIK